MPSWVGVGTRFNIDLYSNLSIGVHQVMIVCMYQQAVNILLEFVENKKRLCSQLSTMNTVKYDMMNRYVSSRRAKADACTQVPTSL